MTARPFDSRDRVAPAVKPMQIIEPEGKNYTITGEILFTGGTGIFTSA